MSAIVPFTFEDTTIRTLTRADEPWFVLADVCRVLKLENPTCSAARLMMMKRVFTV